MHERSLVNALLAQVAELAAQERASAVRRVRVRVGAFAGVDTELFRMALADTSTVELFVSTEYDVVEAPLRAVCLDCGTRFELAEARFQCLNCHSPAVKIVEGDAVILEDVELLLHGA